MIITRRHAVLISKLKHKWAEGLELDRAADDLTEKDLEYLVHLELSGLTEETDDGYVLTQAGHIVSEALDECMEKTGIFQDWPDNFKFIGSEIISGIEIARQAQGELGKQPEIAAELEERGMARDGRLLPVAESILEAYDSAMPKISLTPAVMEKLRHCPPGPGKKSLLPFSREEIYELEAMRLITFSLPRGHSYSLTGAGQQIRAALVKGLSPSPVLDDELLISSLKDNPGQETREKLQAAGAMDSSGNLLPAGRHLRHAARLLYLEPVEFIPSVSLDGTDFSVLEAISELWEKNRDNPEIMPHIKKIKEFMEHRGVKRPDTHRALMVLESYGLVKPEYSGKGRQVYRLTSLGRRILDDRRQHRLTAVPAMAVLAITTTRAENLSPDDQWIEIAEKNGLVGKGFPTKSGRLFAQMACNINRLPLVDSTQRKVMNVLPFWRGMFVTQISDLLPDLDREDVMAAVDRLAGYGLVDILPGGLCRISDAGESFKRAMSVVPEGMEFHVTPPMLRILAAAADNLEGNKINWKEAERACGLDTETVSETILGMRKLMYIKSDRLTSAGKTLLEGLDLLKKIQAHWEEIEI